MEYAAGGELFERICVSGRFLEDEVKCLMKSFVLCKEKLQHSSWLYFLNALVIPLKSEKRDELTMYLLENWNIC